MLSSIWDQSGPGAKLPQVFIREAGLVFKPPTGPPTLEHRPAKSDASSPRTPRAAPSRSPPDARQDRHAPRSAATLDRCHDQRTASRTAAAGFTELVNRVSSTGSAECPRSSDADEEEHSSGDEAELDECDEDAVSDPVDEPFADPGACEGGGGERGSIDEHGVGEEIPGAVGGEL